MRLTPVLIQARSVRSLARCSRASVPLVPPFGPFFGAHCTFTRTLCQALLT